MCSYQCEGQLEAGGVVGQSEREGGRVGATVPRHQHHGGLHVEEPSLLITQETGGIKNIMQPYNQGYNYRSYRLRTVR